MCLFVFLAWQDQNIVAICQSSSCGEQTQPVTTIAEEIACREEVVQQLQRKKAQHGACRNLKIPRCDSQRFQFDSEFNSRGDSAIAIRRDVIRACFFKSMPVIKCSQWLPHQTLDTSSVLSFCPAIQKCNLSLPEAPSTS